MKKGLLLALVFLSGVASAESKAKAPAMPEVTFEQPVDNYPYMTTKEFEAAKKNAKEMAKRNVARVDVIDENVAMSPEARKIRNLIIGGPEVSGTKNFANLNFGSKGIQTADQLAQLINELDNPDYYFQRDANRNLLPATEKTLPEDAQFIAALLVAMKPYRGITVRAKGLIEDYKFLHSMVVTMLRTSGTGINVFLPTEQWQAGFKYITEPYVGLDESQFINNDEQFRKFMGTEVLTATNWLAARLANLDFSQKPIYFDNKIAYATANFVADEDRFLQLGEAERRSALGAVLLGRSGIYSVISYSWKGLFASIQGTMTKVYGFEQAFNVEGATARRRTQVIKEQYGTLFMKTPAATWAMPKAYESMKEGLKQVEITWEQIQKDQGNSNAFRNLLDPRAFAPFTRIIDTSLSNVRSIVRGDAVVSALVAGESVKFDIQKFFGGASSPNNLLDFLPVGFEEGCKKFLPSAGILGSKKECVSEVAKKTGFEYRNYLEGSPTKWNMSVYNAYFPGMNAKTNKSADKVKSAARILSQSWGGWIIGVPLAGMVL